MRTWIAGLTVALAAIALASCTTDTGNERWTTTENTNVKIDWDAVNEAYRNAEGPKEFEDKVNEIYEGDEVISISVHDLDDTTQNVTGFFDRNGNGQVEEAEKVFTIKRTVKDGKGQYQMSGHGPHYGYYRSPFWDIAGGMMLGAWISGAFRPGYAPMYRQPYVTSSMRTKSLRSHRNSYRAKNPSRFSSSKRSRSGRGFGSGSSPGNRSRGTSSRRSFGGGFGLHNKRGRRRRKKPVRLTA